MKSSDWAQRYIVLTILVNGANQTEITTGATLSGLSFASSFLDMKYVYPACAEN